MDISDFLEEKDFKELNQFLDEKMNEVAGGELMKKILEVFSSEKEARFWFYTRNRGLGYKRPYDACREGDFEIIEIFLRCRNK